MKKWKMRENTATGRHEIHDEDGNLVAETTDPENARRIAAVPEMITTLRHVKASAPDGYAEDSMWATVAGTLTRLEREQPQERECATIGCRETAMPTLIQVAPGTCIQVCAGCREELGK